MHIELRHLRTLSAIQATGSMAEAARQLHLTQSALSHQLKDLEQQIGIQIFIRKSRPIRFSAVGQRLLKLANSVLPDIERAERELLQFKTGQSGRLFISIECHSCFDWLLPTMDVYREDWPQVEMDLTLAHSLNPLPPLAKGEIDLVITSDPIEDTKLCYHPLFRYQSMLLMPKGHPLCRKTYIEPTDLVDETLITYPVERQRLDIFSKFLEPGRITVSDVRTAELTSMIVQLVASRRGVASLPGWAAMKFLQQDSIVARPLGQEGLWATLYAAIRTESESFPYLEEFVTLARKISFKNLQGIEPA